MNPGKWETLKSGVLKNGIWYAKTYPKGWYFYNTEHVSLGPFKSFEEGLKSWAKEK